MTTVREISNRPAPTRQNNRSTRSTRSTRAVKPESKRNQTAAEYAAEVQAKKQAKQQVRMIRTEPVAQARPAVSARQQARVRQQAPPGAPARQRPSTRRVIYTEAPAPKRIEVFSEKREQSRLKAPLQFTAIMFGAVIVSVAAFGMLRGEVPVPSEGAPLQNAAAESETDQQGNPLYEVLKFESPGSTSTNTSILRGNESQP